MCTYSVEERIKSQLVYQLKRKEGLVGLLNVAKQRSRTKWALANLVDPDQWATSKTNQDLSDDQRSVQLEKEKMLLCSCIYRTAKMTINSGTVWKWHLVTNSGRTVWQIDQHDCERLCYWVSLDWNAHRPSLSVWTTIWSHCWGYWNYTQDTSDTLKCLPFSRLWSNKCVNIVYIVIWQGRKLNEKQSKNRRLFDFTTNSTGLVVH